MKIELYGKMPDGTDVHRITLKGGGLSANVLTYGGVIQDLRLDGHAPALVLGFEHFEHYLAHSPYFGANAGRCANRIRDGHLALSGKTYQLDQNFLERHHLHGGKAGMGKSVWDIETFTEESATLAIHLPDGDMGYPGNMTIKLTYRLLAQGILDIHFWASSDQQTLCNLTHHSYFNLDGQGDINGHLLQVDAPHFTPVDDELIPTGELCDVGQTTFDFRAPKPVGEAAAGQILDHNFCVAQDRGALRKIACLQSPQSCVTMDILSTEPGLQVYDGAKINIPVAGLDGREMLPHAGIALEPQVWPDANHHAHFPQAVLAPGDTYQQHTQYIFNKDQT